MENEKLRIRLPAAFKLEVHNGYRVIELPINDNLAGELVDKLDRSLSQFVSPMLFDNESLEFLVKNNVLYVGELVQGVPHSRARAYRHACWQAENVLASLGLWFGWQVVGWERPEIRRAKEAAAKLARERQNLWPRLDERFVDWPRFRKVKGLAVKVGEICEANGILYIGDLVQKTEAELLAIKGLGPSSITELAKWVMEGYGYNKLVFGMTNADLFGWVRPEKREDQTK